MIANCKCKSQCESAMQTCAMNAINAMNATVPPGATQRVGPIWAQELADRRKKRTQRLLDALQWSQVGLSDFQLHKEIQSTKMHEHT